MDSPIYGKLSGNGKFEFPQVAGTKIPSVKRILWSGTKRYAEAGGV